MAAWQPSADPAGLTARARILSATRDFFQQRQVLEVQTPVLGRHSVTDPDVEGVAVAGYGYLQTSPEYFMKRLLAAGMPDCYQLGPAFRHEEAGRHHNPEFTLLEWYRLGIDERALMLEVEALVDQVLGPGDYEEIPYWHLLTAAGCTADSPRHELDLAFAEACAGLNPGRFFVTQYPAPQAALARLRRSPVNEIYAARFELVVDGLELANGYWELLDADEHAQRFAGDNEVRTARGLPAHTPDPEFLAALAQGLPACAGVALGMDRLVMLALGKTHIREVLAFAWQ